MEVEGLVVLPFYGTRELVLSLRVSDIVYDRICAIHFCDPVDNSSTVSVIGVYLHCSDQGMDCYREHLQQLERIMHQ